MRERTKRSRQVIREITSILSQVLRKCYSKGENLGLCTMMCFHLVRVILQFPGVKSQMTTRARKLCEKNRLPCSHGSEDLGQTRVLVLQRSCLPAYQSLDVIRK